jgi:hypothetical protein
MMYVKANASSARQRLPLFPQNLDDSPSDNATSQQGNSDGFVRHLISPNESGETVKLGGDRFKLA